MKKLMTPVVLALLTSSASLRAEVVMSNLGLPYEDGRPLEGSVLSGLAFKTGPVGGNISDLSFSLIAVGVVPPFPMFTFSASLYALDGSHLPTGSALATQGGLSATFSGTPIVQESFSYDSSQLASITAIPLTANTEYAVLLGNCSGNGLYYWAAESVPLSYDFNGSGYSFVGIVDSDNNGSSWTLNQDWGYIASISVTPVPEPGMCAFMAIGTISLLVFRRRRTS